MKLCARCKQDRGTRKHRYCGSCQAAYMRVWRLGQEPSAEQAKRDRCRAYAREYRKRGKLIAQPCRSCGAEKVEAHHEDYDKPLDVVWLCRSCHLKHHAQQRKATGATK